MFVPAPEESGDGVVDVELEAQNFKRKDSVTKKQKRERQLSVAEEQQLVTQLRSMLIQFLAPGSLSLSELQQRTSDVAPPEMVSSVLSTIAARQEGDKYELLADPSVWSAVNVDDADYTPSQREAVIKQRKRLVPALSAKKKGGAADRKQLITSWGPDVQYGAVLENEELRGELLRQYQAYRDEAREICRRFELMGKFMLNAAPASDKLWQQVIEDHEKSKPRLLQLKELARELRIKISQLP
jgi:hypothetical protein